VIAENIYRRHLKPKEKLDLLVKLIAMQPEKSDRQIGRSAKRRTSITRRLARLDAN
jgi:ParB-like chromosome segregation protein Spo0J